jgi:hypothetical protein
LTTDESIVTVNSSQFDFALRIESYSGNSTLNKNIHKYVKIFIALYDEEWIVDNVTGISNYIYTEYDYNLIPCPEGKFLNNTAFEEALGITDTFLCIENTTVNL